VRSPLEATEPICHDFIIKTWSEKKVNSSLYQEPLMQILGLKKGTCSGNLSMTGTFNFVTSTRE
jgi:hypothetical protein